MHDACFTLLAFSPPPYRPNSSGSLIDLPGPKIKESGHPARAASSEDVQRTGVVELAEEEMIKPSQTSDTNQAYVIGLHAVFTSISFRCNDMLTSANRADSDEMAHNDEPLHRDLHCLLVCL